MVAEEGNIRLSWRLGTYDDWLASERHGNIRIENLSFFPDAYSGELYPPVLLLCHLSSRFRCQLRGQRHLRERLILDKVPAKLMSESALWW